MKLLLLSLTLCLCALGQNVNNMTVVVSSGSGAPSNPCPTTRRVYVNTTNGDFYDCQGGASNWNKVSGGGGGDTITSPNSTISIGGTTSNTTLDTSTKIPTVAAVQSGVPTACANSSGTSTFACTFVGTGSLALTQYSLGMRIYLTSNAASANSSTVNIDSVGAVGLYLADCSTAIGTTVTTAGQFTFWYNGATGTTNGKFCLEGPTSSGGSSSSFVDYQAQTGSLSISSSSGSPTTIYTTTVAGGTIAAGHCLSGKFWYVPTTLNNLTVALTWGATTVVVAAPSASSSTFQYYHTALICNAPGSTTAQQITLSPFIFGSPTAAAQGVVYFYNGVTAAAETSASNVTLKLTVYSAGSGDTMVGTAWAWDHN